MLNATTQYLTEAKATEYLRSQGIRVGRNFLREMRKAGKISCHRFSERRLLYSMTQIEDFLKRSQQGAYR